MKQYQVLFHVHKFSVLFVVVFLSLQNMRVCIYESWAIFYINAQQEILDEPTTVSSFFYLLDFWSLLTQLERFICFYRKYANAIARQYIFWSLRLHFNRRVVIWSLVQVKLFPISLILSTEESI